MKKIKAFLAAIASIFLLIITSFGLGRKRGREKAQAEFDKKRTEEKASASIAVADRLATASKGANDVQEAIKRMGDDAIDRELRERFTRPGGG